MHVGWYHLGVNCAMQLFFGASVEMVHGHLTLLCVYTFGVAMGALTCAFADVHRAVVGASGGVFARGGRCELPSTRALICTAVPALDMLVYLLVYSDADTSRAARRRARGGLSAGPGHRVDEFASTAARAAAAAGVRRVRALLAPDVYFERLYNGPFWRRNQLLAAAARPSPPRRLDCDDDLPDHLPLASNTLKSALDVALEIRGEFFAQRPFGAG